MGKPTIEELERILDGNVVPIKIMPNGELKTDFEGCVFREQCHTSKPKEPAALSASPTNTEYKFIDVHAALRYQEEVVGDSHSLQERIVFENGFNAARLIS